MARYYRFNEVKRIFEAVQCSAEEVQDKMKEEFKRQKAIRQKNGQGK